MKPTTSLALIGIILGNFMDNPSRPRRPQSLDGKLRQQASFVRFWIAAGIHQLCRWTHPAATRCSARANFEFQNDVADVRDVQRIGNQYFYLEATPGAGIAL
jgi:hypothetical protein